MTAAADPAALDAVRKGGKAALARALAQIEARADAPETWALLNDAWNSPKAHVIGLTGPPGVGKSTLTKALIAAWRGQGRTVAVIAVDPSSKASGGALLGDRVRLGTDPEDDGLFVRSMAARDRLGGLAELTMPAMVLMRALYDMVLIETVGVGQSETDVAEAADTVVFCIQPGSGDSLQYMKAGIMEVPHILAVTKADMGAAAKRARADVRGALSLAEPGGTWKPPVLLVSASTGDGVADLVAAIDSHRAHLAAQDELADSRRRQGQAWLLRAIETRFGREGRKLAQDLDLPEESPFAALQAAVARLRVVTTP